jgi:hypothetical protein
MRVLCSNAETPESEEEVTQGLVNQGVSIKSNFKPAGMFHAL